MSKQFRRIIFWIFVLFFIATSVIIALYAQGYNFDFHTFKIVKTGGIFIKTSIADAKIYINDKYIESTGGILNHSYLAAGLLPRNYNVFVYKEGYYPWNKVIEVKDGLVAELDRIILLPLQLKTTKIAEIPVQLISEFTVDKETFGIKNNNIKTIKVYNFSGKLISNGKFKIATSSEEILSPNKNKKVYVSDNKIFVNYLKDASSDSIASFEEPLKLLDWFRDSEHIIWFSGSDLSIAELDNQGGKRNIVKFYLNIEPPFYFDRDNSDFYFFKNTDKASILYKINFGT